MGVARKLQRRRNDWSIRMQFEFDFWQKRDSVPVVALLTYDEQHLHRTSLGNGSLCERDVQLFMKRLRKKLSKEQVFIRYFYCGEYGPDTGRPHYHILVFGIPNSYSRKKIFELFQSPWEHGFVGNEIDRVRSKQGSTQYVTKYMLTHYLPRSDPEQVKEFNRFSKGLGISFVHPVEIDEHGLHVGKDKITDRRFRNDVYYSQLLELFDQVYPFIPGYGRSDHPAVDYDSQEAIDIARFVQECCRDRIRMTCKTKSYSFKLPRYIREKLFYPHERHLINFADCVLYHLPKFREYQEKYYEYDEQHDIPMSVLLELEEERRLLSFFIKKRKEEKV